MRTINVPGGEIVFLDSPLQLPESLRTEHNYYALIESGIGSDFEAVDEHFANVIALIQAGDIEGAMNGLNNKRYLFYNLYNKQYSARSLALASLTYTVNGEGWKDYSEQGLTRLVEKFSEMGLTDEIIIQVWGDVKKKSTLN